jgi:transposase
VICTPSVVGILSERGLSLHEIAKRLKVSYSTARRYLKEWKSATPEDRKLARSGTNVSL